MIITITYIQGGDAGIGAIEQEPKYVANRQHFKVNPTKHSNLFGSIEIEFCCDWAVSNIKYEFIGSELDTLLTGRYDDIHEYCPSCGAEVVHEEQYLEFVLVNHTTAKNLRLQEDISRPE